MKESFAILRYTNTDGYLFCSIDYNKELEQLKSLTNKDLNIPKLEYAMPKQYMYVEEYIDGQCIAEKIVIL